MTTRGPSRRYRVPVSWFRRSPSDGPAEAPRANPGVEAIAHVDPLTEDEVVWVRSTIAELTEQDVRSGDIDDLGRHYDELLATWLRLRESDRPDPHGVINQIGLAFGQYVADHTDLAWGVATNQRGVEIALHRERSQAPVLLYPTDMVSQHWEARETGILPALARATVDAIERTRAASDVARQPSGLSADSSAG